MRELRELLGEETGRLDLSDRNSFPIKYARESIEYVRRDHLNEEGKWRTVKILVLTGFTYLALC